MPTKHISDWQVCEAAASGHYASSYLIEDTGECFKVCLNALYRAEKRGLIHIPGSASGVLTQKGKVLLKQARQEQTPEALQHAAYTRSVFSGLATQEKSKQANFEAGILSALESARKRLLAPIESEKARAEMDMATAPAKAGSRKAARL